MASAKLALAAVLLTATAGFAIAQSATKTASGIPAPLIDGLHPGAYVEQYVAQSVGRLRAADRNGDGLDAGDLSFLKMKGEAQQRANSVGQMLARDFDGDFKVTRAELALDARGGVRDQDELQRGQQIESFLGQYDRDGDGVITLQEAAAGNGRERRTDDRLEQLLDLDPSGDGRLTAKELTALAQRAFERIDSNGDGQLSREEHALVADDLRELQYIRNAATCTLPPVPQGAKLIAYGGYEADAIASAAVGGAEQETNLLDVRIEPGAEPLYLVLTSYESMIWRLSGATGRITNLVISSAKTAPGGGAASGAIGLPAAKVTFAERDCPGYFYGVSDNDTKRVTASLRASLKRAPDAIFGAYSAQRVSLPTGAITRASADQAMLPKGFDKSLWPEATRFWPGGLVTVDPRSVVARARVESYKVLPSQMGLAQLVGSGAMTREGDGVFRLVRPIPHMPPSMGGAHSVTLIVPKGIPVPPGSPGHSCIVSEATGQKQGARCGR